MIIMIIKNMCPYLETNSFFVTPPPFPLFFYVWSLLYYTGNNKIKMEYFNET